MVIRATVIRIAAVITSNSANNNGLLCVMYITQSMCLSIQHVKCVFYIFMCLSNLGDQVMDTFLPSMCVK